MSKKLTIEQAEARHPDMVPGQNTVLEDGLMNEVKSGTDFTGFIKTPPRLGLRDRCTKIFSEGRSLGCETITIYCGTEEIADDVRHITGAEMVEAVIDYLSDNHQRYFVLRKKIGVPRVERVPTAIDYAGRTPLPQRTYPDWGV